MAPNLTPQTPPEATDPIEVVRRVVERLDRLGISYFVAGSFASSIHGFVRFTQDADLIVDLRSEQVEKFLHEFVGEFYCDRGLIEQALKHGSSFNVIHVGSSFKVDLFLIGWDPFKREELSRRRLEPMDPEGGVQAFVQTAEDALLSKLEWYRTGGEVSENQWRDVLGILKVKQGQLDGAYLRKWADELGVSDLLQRATEEAGVGDKGRHKTN